VIDIIIINYNNAKYLQELLQALINKESATLTRRAEYKITVVDNRSNDGSAAMVESVFPTVNLIQRAENDGYSAAVNEGLASTTNHQILLLNSDVLITPKQVAALSRIWERHDMNIILGPLHLEPDGYPQLTWGDYPSPANEARRKRLEAALTSRADWARQKVMSQACRTRGVAWVSGSCMFFARDAVDAIGPWDQNFFLFFEDIDWCLRAQEHEIPVVHTGEVHIQHEHGASVNLDPDTSEIEYRLSQCYFTQKYFGKWSLLWLRFYLTARMLGRMIIGGWSGYERGTSWQILKEVWRAPGT